MIFVGKKYYFKLLSTARVIGPTKSVEGRPFSFLEFHHCRLGEAAEISEREICIEKASAYKKLLERLHLVISCTDSEIARNLHHDAGRNH